MKNQKKLDLLESCLEYLESGASLEECYHKFPELSSDMHLILETAFQIKDLSQDRLPDEASARNRRAFLLHARELRYQASPINSVSRITSRLQSIKSNLFARPLLNRLILILGSTALLVLFSGGLVITSAKSLPGDSLYPVKRAVEDLSVQLMPIQGVRNQYENDINQERVSEITRLIELKRIQNISFSGTVQSISPENWLVSGIHVHITDDTRIEEDEPELEGIEIGSTVNVAGTTDEQGWVTANQIKPEKYQLVGSVEKMGPSAWVIAGKQVRITEDTQLPSDIQVGDQVAVMVRIEDNSLYALAIQVEQRLTSTSEIPSQEPATPTSIHPGDNEDHKAAGILGLIAENYWVVDGQTYYLTQDTHLPEKFQLGESFKIVYRMDADGAFIAIEIERVESESPTQVYQSTATPAEHKEDEHLSTVTETPSPGLTPAPQITPTPQHEEEQHTPVPSTSVTPQHTDDD